MTPEEALVELVNAYKRLFATEDGKLVLKDLKSKTTFDCCSFKMEGPRAGPIDCDRLVADEARRGLMLYVVSRIEMDMGKRKSEQTQNEERSNG